MIEDDAAMTLAIPLAKVEQLIQWSEKMGRESAELAESRSSVVSPLIAATARLERDCHEAIAYVLRDYATQAALAGRPAVPLTRVNGGSMARRGARDEGEQNV